MIFILFFLLQTDPKKNEITLIILEKKDFFFLITLVLFIPILLEINILLRINLHDIYLLYIYDALSYNMKTFFHPNRIEKTLLSKEDYFGL